MQFSPLTLFPDCFFDFFHALRVFLQSFLIFLRGVLRVFLQSFLIFLRGMLPIFSAVSHFFPECFLISFFPFLPVFSHQCSPVDVPHVIMLFTHRLFSPVQYIYHINVPILTVPIAHILFPICLPTIYIVYTVCIYIYSYRYVYIYSLYIYTTYVYIYRYIIIYVYITLIIGYIDIYICIYLRQGR